MLSTFIGAWITPPLSGVLPATGHGESGKLGLEITSGVIAVAGIVIAAVLWLGRRTLVSAIAASGIGRFLSRWWFAAWGFDWLYDLLFVKTFRGIAWLLKSDPFNGLLNLLAVISRAAGRGIAVSESGYLRWYVASMGIGAVVVLALMLVV